MTTLAATALRLTAREVLAPYAAIQAQTGFPTIAQDRVFDSAIGYVDEIRDADAPLPTITLYTPGVAGRVRGDAQSSGVQDCAIDLHVSIMMAIIDDETPEPSVMAAESSAKAEAMLDFLGWQIRYALTGSHEYAIGFRAIAKKIPAFDQRSYYLPEMQMNISQRDLIFTCLCDDFFQTDAGTLPANIEKVRLWLPQGSDGRRYLDEIAAAIDPVTRTPLGDILLGANFDGTMPADFDTAEVKGRVDTDPPFEGN